MLHFSVILTNRFNKTESLASMQNFEKAGMNLRVFTSGGGGGRVGRGEGCES